MVRQFKESRSKWVRGAEAQHELPPLLCRRKFSEQEGGNTKWGGSTHACMHWCIRKALQ